jgi:hypothetical protein
MSQCQERALRAAVARQPLQPLGGGALDAHDIVLSMQAGEGGLGRRLAPCDALNVTCVTYARSRSDRQCHTVADPLRGSAPYGADARSAGGPLRAPRRGGCQRGPPPARSARPWSSARGRAGAPAYGHVRDARTRAFRTRPPPARSARPWSSARGRHRPACARVHGHPRAPAGGRSACVAGAAPVATGGGCDRRSHPPRTSRKWGKKRCQQARFCAVRIKEITILKLTQERVLNRIVP